MKKTEDRKNFYLSKKYLNKGLVIQIRNQGFEYNHDDVFNNNRDRFTKGGSAHKSWNKYGYYTKTTGYPKWAGEYISIT